jgi:hypothetical protein
MSAPFEEHSGVVLCGTLGDQWYQTLEEVFIEVQVPPGTLHPGYPVRIAEPINCAGHGQPRDPEGQTL